MQEPEQIRLKLQSVLSPKRYVHTLGVAATAVDLSKTHGESCYNAEIAALLHDCAKDMPNKLKLSLCHEYHIKIDKIMKEQPDLTHSFLGAEIAAREYGVCSHDIINAIKYHTTGRENMSRLEKIIYLADYFEPNRKPFKSMEKIKALSYLDLNKAMVFSLKESIEYIKKKNLKLHGLTLSALNYYENIVNDELKQ